MKKALVIVLHLLVAANSAQAAEAVPGAIYRWVDPKGVIHYSDRPAPVADNPRTEKAVIKSDLAGGDNTGAFRQLANELKNGAQKQRDAVEAEKTAKEAAAQNVAREKACSSAKEAFRIFSAGGRIATVNEKGEKAVLEDAEIQSKTAEASKAVEEACAPPKPAPAAPAAPAAPTAPTGTTPRVN